MLQRGLDQFKGKRVLLLQGPVGPFFSLFAKDLRDNGAQVLKVNFNAGDWYYYQKDAINYRGTPENWPKWFEDLICRLEIDVVYLFGDCRAIHKAAVIVLAKYKIELGVFEEGYIRPDYVTLERFGVNGYSRRLNDRKTYLNELPDPRKIDVGSTYWSMVRYSFWYFLFGSLGKIWFMKYQHHRPLTLLEAIPWARSIWRKQWYRWIERHAQDELLKGQSRKRFFLVPLQVFNDAQLSNHAEFSSVENFIETILQSFAQHAPENILLVLKHHPMDRGYKDYTKLINRLSDKFGISTRVRYIHDQHLPSLLNHARGVVTVNSTVGISAIFHGAPTLVCGRAIYNISGLTFQGPLDQFWKSAPGAQPNLKLYKRFTNSLISETQLNGSFYKIIKSSTLHTGLIWKNHSIKMRMSHPYSVSHTAVQNDLQSKCCKPVESLH